MTNFIDNALNNMLSKGKNKSASITKQQQWKSMSPVQKNNARMRWKDSDGDGIPNRWDCQSRNPFRQDNIMVGQKVKMKTTASSEYRGAEQGFE